MLPLWLGVVALAQDVLPHAGLWGFRLSGLAFGSIVFFFSGVEGLGFRN